MNNAKKALPAPPDPMMIFERMNNGDPLDVIIYEEKRAVEGEIIIGDGSTDSSDTLSRIVCSRGTGA